MSLQTPVHRAPRFVIALSAEVKTPTFQTAGTTRNVSTGGVCVEIDRDIPEGQVVEIVLFLVEDDIEAEGKRALSLTGAVQWSGEGDRGYQVGLRFIDPPADKVAMLERVISLLNPDA
ncbi:MAG: PilZ domain-containing protein [Polyangia bacterium]